MIIQLTADCSGAQQEEITRTVTERGWKATPVKTQRGHYIVAIGTKEFDIRVIGHLAGVKDVHRVSEAFRLVSRKWKVDPTVIEVGDDSAVQSDGFTLVMGPCSIESEDQIVAVVDFLADRGIRFLRGGAFKPRTSPYSFRGLGLDGLKLCHDIASRKGIKVISEVVSASDIERMYPYVDVYQVGARNTQNFHLLHELGQVDKPVLLKRGMSGTLEELLQSAEYIFANGNERLILCERGIRTFENAYRNTLDLNAVPLLQSKTHLPVFVDPSHGIGIRKHVETMSLAGVMAGADGLLIEIHPEPEKALSDGQQTLSFDEAAELHTKLKALTALRASFV